MRVLSPHIENPTAPRGLSRYFPPPKFLAMPAVGLDISDTAVRFIEFVGNGTHFRVGRFGARSLPAGVIVGGYIEKKDELARAIRSLQTEFKLDFVRVSLPDEKAYLFKTQIPKMPEREIRGAIELRLEENVPIPPANAVFGYHIIDSQKKESEHLDVAVTVVPQKVAAAYVEVLEKGGVTTISFEISARSVANAVLSPEDHTPVLVVNFGEARTGISVVADGAVSFISTIPLGEDAIVSALAKHFEVSEKEAYEIKEKRGFVKTGENITLFRSLASELSAITEEIKKVLVYWQTHGGGAETVEEIRKIILVGRGSDLAGFSEYLSESVGKPVGQGHVWRNAFSLGAYIPPIPMRDALDYAAAIGLALPREWNFE